MYRAILSIVAAGLLIAMQATFCRSARAATGLASYYGAGDGFNGSPTANGERFNAGALTAASLTLPFGTMVRVTYQGRSVVVRINDRGPYVGGRIIDLSAAAASAIGMTGAGVGYVSVDVVGGSSGGSGYQTATHKATHARVQVASAPVVHHKPRLIQVASIKVKHPIRLAHATTTTAYGFVHQTAIEN